MGHRNLAGEADKAELRGGVGCAIGRTAQTADRRGIDDAARATRRHSLERGAATEERTLEVYVDHLVPKSFGRLHAVREAVEDTCIVDHDVKRTEPVLGSLNK